MGEKARITQLYPTGAGPMGLLAVDLLEIEPGGSTAMLRHTEEQVLYVLSGTGEVRGGDSVAALVRANSALFIGPREAHMLRNTGSDSLRVLVATPLLVRSDRALGREGRVDAVEKEADGERPSPRLKEPRPEPLDQRTEAELSVNEGPPPDISSLMKRGSEIVVGARPERKRGVPEPVPEPQQAEAEADATVAEEEEQQPELMELAVVFDGGSRGNPGQGYGAYLVQSPGRKPVIKRVEFGDNYTNGQAEYESLIACLQYIIERLTATNRVPAQVALDIKSDSESLVNQLQGNYKVKDAGVRQRHARALELLEEFGAWIITLHSREEGAELLGH
jgi:ribonuclease HI